MRTRKLGIFRITVTAALTLFSVSAVAVPFTQVRIGDQDGFGYGAAAGLVGADGSAANRNGTPLLDQNDLLPDLNKDGFVATGYGDDFDNRLSEGYSCIGCVNGGGMAGVDYTDISLSTSYDTSSANNNVYDANTATYGTGGAFPSIPSASLPNQPGFNFDFTVGSGDISTSAILYFNLIFGDYDVTPANITFTRADGSTFTKGLTVQAANKDGLIQSAFAQLSFADVFTGITGGYQGTLGVDFVAPNEPYTAFDFVELATKPISSNPLPEPGDLSLLSVGLLGIWMARRRKV